MWTHFWERIYEDAQLRTNLWGHTFQNEPLRNHNWERTYEDAQLRTNLWGGTTENEPIRKHIEKVPKRTHNWEQTNEDAELRTNQWEHTMHKCINKCILIKNSYASFGDKLRTCNNLNLINSNCIYKCIDLNWLIQHFQAGFESIIILLVF